MTNISRALTISGFMSKAELTWLAEQASRSLLIAEIGCWQGRSTRALADNTLGTVFAIDHFRGVPEIQHLLEGKPTGWLLKTFLMNLFDRENVVLVRRSSHDGACLLNSFRFDMVFIDGAHDYDSVTEDIWLWRPLVAPNGILCGHDYRDAAGVEQAVLDSDLEDIEIVPETSLWWVRL